MKNSKIHILFIAVFATFQLGAQTILTKKEAIKIALENNYGIKIAYNNVEVAKNNSGIYNSRYLPSVSASTGANYSNNNQDITAQSGAATIVNGAVTKSYNASVNLKYTLFDGLGRKYNYQQLKETYNLSQLQVRETIENTYLQLFTVYFQIARLSENTNSLQEALTISKQRLKRAEYQYEYGQSTKIALLNAQVDVNNDSVSLLNTRQQYSNAKRSLNIVLGVAKQQDFEVETVVNFNRLLEFSELLELAKSNNTLLKKNKKNIAISAFNIKINKASFLPKVSLTTSYGWNKSTNPATSFFAQSQSNGMNAGLNLSWNIFDGGSTKTRVANSKIALETQKIAQQQQKETVTNTLKSTWDSYQNSLFILKAQEQNIQTSQNNFNRTGEKYKLGQVTSIEFRQAQVNLINTKTALINAKFDAKLIELQLLQLSGQLINSAI
jgi:outer membrane protein TolC